LEGNCTGDTHTKSQPETLAPQQPHSNHRSYGGIRRLPYLAILIALPFIHQSLVAQYRANGGYLVVTSFVVFTFLVASYTRLQNLGRNPWWCLTLLIPIVCLWFGSECLVCREGYADKIKDDTDLLHKDWAKLNESLSRR